MLLRNLMQHEILLDIKNLVKNQESLLPVLEDSFSKVKKSKTKKSNPPKLVLDNESSVYKL
jgi:hypothetical protein